MNVRSIFTAFTFAAISTSIVDRAAAQTAETFDCGYRSPAAWMADWRAGIERGEIADPATRAIPQVASRRGGSFALGGGTDLSPAHVFPFEDSGQLLLTNFTNAQLIDLMVSASNQLLAVHGDTYDFIGFWVNFTPDHLVGTAFYKPIENDVAGIGDASTVGTPIFNLRPNLGLAGDNIEGFIMMWDINSSHWQPGTGGGASFTRLALGQEFEHRFALFLPDLIGGRVMQGNNGSCGRIFHWNWQIDGQGSCMEISEWVGSSPAALAGSFVTFNTDIGGIFSYSDLYLMGYVSPAEMDAGNSELRFMDNSSCGQLYNGPISSFSSAEIIVSAGPRVPDSASAQKHFRTGWIMIHQPGDLPSASELNKAVAILEQHEEDWEFSTLGRGSMNDSLFDDCNANDVSDTIDITTGFSLDLNSNGIPDECECVVQDHCAALPNSTGLPGEIGASGSLSVAANDFSLVGTALPPSQTGIFFYGPNESELPFGDGFLCISGAFYRLSPVVAADLLGFAELDVDFTAPPEPAGAITPFSTWRFQLWYRDPAAGGAGFNLTAGFAVTFCP